MKRSLLAIAFATLVGAAAPAQALGPASVGIAPDAPITQASAARERRIQIMHNLMAAQRRHGHGHGHGYGRGHGHGYGYGGPPRHRHHHHHHHRHGW